jgi:transcriptional regulator with XRE-family HTH domain
MANIPLAFMLRTKIIGVLIRDARLAVNKTVDECGKAIGVSGETFEQYELGTKLISLPELEGLSYFLGVPLEHFWKHEAVSSGEEHRQLSNISQLIALRQRIIGTLLRQARQESGLSLEALAEQTKVDASRLEDYELGKEPVPIPELEMLTGVLNRSIREFQDQHGPVGVWNTRQENIKDFLRLPLEMQSFVSKPINRPYLELAIRLSEMSVDKLRAVAEGLLEITY